MDLKLKVLEGKSVGQEIPVRCKKFFIGRAEDCQLRPGSDLISRHHCVLLVEDGYIGVRDFGSKNGTFINDERVVGERELKPGDRLTVRKVVGVLIAYAGIVVLFAGQTGGAASLLGDAIVFVSAFLLAERLVYLARAVQSLDPVKLLLSQAAIGSMLFMLGSALTEPMPTAWTVRLGASVAYQGVLIAGFNFVVNMWLLQRYRPSSLVPFFLTQPLFGVLAAAVVAGDPLTWELLLACVAVGIGMGLTTR